MLEPGASSSYVDVLIGMDATGSMGGWIHAARDTVLDAFEDLQRTYPNALFRLGVVCYRDYGDPQRFVILPFTSKVEEVQQALRKVVAMGGNDAAEDVAGGLHHIVEMFREPHPQTETPIRVLLFVADAPAHGVRYHTATVSDRFPNGDPDGYEPFDQMRELADMGVDTTLFRIHATMDKMIEEFSTAYEDSGSTFTLLDVASQECSSDRGGTGGGRGTYRRSYVAEHRLCEEDHENKMDDRISGYMDLASYDEMPPLLPSLASSCSSSPADYMRLATCTSVSASVQRRLENTKRESESVD